MLVTADVQGTFEIMRRTGMSKPRIWRWQERYLDEGVPGLKRDKTRPSRVQPLPREVRLKVIAKTVQETPSNATHWSRAAMAEAFGISPSSVGRIAARYNPDLKQQYQTMIQAGKPAKIALTALMRKMIELANALVQQNRKWTLKAA